MHACLFALLPAGCHRLRGLWLQLTSWLLFWLWLAFVQLIALMVGPSQALAFGAGQIEASYSIAGPDRPHLLELQEAIYRRILWVKEFKQIQRVAKRLGVKKLYLFGGSAAVFAHYVKWDLERQHGLRLYHDGRFDYRYESIFRLSQDLDLVVDVQSPSDLHRFQQALGELSRFQGARSVVGEVLALHTDTPKRQALLRDKNFLTQHSDSHSTGLIEIPLIHTALPPDVSYDVVKASFKDLRHWQAPRAPFIQDVFLQRLTCYYSPLDHRRTSRFKNGHNPDVFFAIRALTKAFQYNLSLSSECEVILKQIFEAFDPAQDLKTAYAHKWIRKNAKKLYQNAIDLEYAQFILNKLGALKALQKINSQHTGPHTLAWWLQQHALKGEGQKPVASKRPRRLALEQSPEALTEQRPDLLDRASPPVLTAKMLGLELIEHSMPSYLFYEMVEKSYSFQSNVFQNLEAGFQADVLQAKARTFEASEGRDRVALIFRLHPQARLNIDFQLQNKKITVFNKYALQLVVDSLQIDPLVYFRQLARMGYVFVDNTKEVLDRIDYQLNQYLLRNTKQRHKLAQFIFHFFKKKSKAAPSVLTQWLRLEVSSRHPDLVQHIITNQKHLNVYIVRALGYKHWATSQPASKWLQYFIQKGGFYKEIVHHVLNKKIWAQHPNAIEWLREICLRSQMGWLAAVRTLRHPAWLDNPQATDLMDELLTHPQYDAVVVEKLLSRHHWATHHQAVAWLEKIIRRGQVDWQVIVHCLQQPLWAEHQDGGRLIDLILNNKTQAWAVPEHILKQPHWAQHPRATRWIKLLKAQGHSPRLKQHVACPQLLQTR